MNTLFATTILAAAALGAASAAQAADCGTVSLAVNNVQSAEVLTMVDKFILEHGYGCSVETMPGDTVPTVTSMVEKAQPDVSSETWVNLLPEVVTRGLADHKIVEAAAALPDGGVQGWWIPKYLADAHPEIRTVEDALAQPALFPDPEDSGKGVIFSGAEGWGGTVVTEQLFKAYGAEAKGFTLMSPGSAAGLDGAIAKAYERQQGFITYYWSPTSLLGKYPMVMLSGGQHDAAEWKRCITVADCPDPKPTAWPVDEVRTLLTQDFASRTTPEILAYFNSRGWSNDTVSKLMAWQTGNQATGEDGAVQFLRESKDIWTQWVPADVAAKVEVAL